MPNCPATPSNQTAVCSSVTNSGKAAAKFPAISRNRPMTSGSACTKAASCRQTKGATNSATPTSPLTNSKNAK